ncbi:CUE domain-containing protein 1 [Armadillidium nasatum]|uniref:CUE domain-containing protein 1 n=1 Tax=Armadillidium nasatum TaxID=96803 RepID=A0A5N5TII9_9CRUS|nr:CUE domain-containing protein 1 [Armadillidium nasatum]
MAEMGEAPAMQLDFNEAMQDFRTMFPDMDADVIEAVLRSNRGAVHETIDQLLAMVTDVENQKSSSHSSGCHLEATVEGDRGRNVEGATNYELPPSYALSATPPPSYHQAVPSPYRSPAYVDFCTYIYVYKKMIEFIPSS